MFYILIFLQLVNQVLLLPYLAGFLLHLQFEPSLLCSPQVRLLQFSMLFLQVLALLFDHSGEILLLFVFLLDSDLDISLLLPGCHDDVSHSLQLPLSLVL